MITIMGAGIFQIRRTKNIITTVNKTNVPKNPLPSCGKTLFTDERKWRMWIQSLGAQNISMANFYLGDAKSKGAAPLTDGEREFILREFFIDAVNVNALFFCVKVNPKDFSFRLGHGMSNGTDLIMEYAPKGVKEATGVAPFYSFYLTKSHKTSAVNDIFWSFRSAMLSVSNSL